MKIVLSQMISMCSGCRKCRHDKQMENIPDRAMNKLSKKCYHYSCHQASHWRGSSMWFEAYRLGITQFFFSSRVSINGWRIAVNFDFIDKSTQNNIGPDPENILYIRIRAAVHRSMCDDLTTQQQNNNNNHANTRCLCTDM